MMDQEERQPTADNAQQAREKGAAVQYDTEDEGALDKSASPPDPKTTTRREGKQHHD